MDPSELTAETLLLTPRGSPVKRNKFYNFLSVNGRFTPDVVGSGASTRSSSLATTPLPPSDFELDDDDNQEYDNNDLKNLMNLKEPIRSRSRRHSAYLNTQSENPSPLPGQQRSGRATPVFTWNPLPGETHLIYTTDENNLIYPAQVEIEKPSKPSSRRNSLPKDNQTTATGVATDNLYPNCDVNVWLRSCEEEIVDPIEGVISGIIPDWLNGSLLRNGPGNLKVGEMQFNHLFDSSALLHRFAIHDGKVTYQCRFLQTETLKKNTAANRIVVTEFGTSAVPDPCNTIFQRVSSMFKPGASSSDNAMISIYPFGDEYFAFTENPVIHKIDPETLTTEERLNISEYVGIVNHTSHPHVMSDGTVFNLGMSVTKTGPAYNIICFPYGQHMFHDAHIVASVPARWKLHPGYMHTFGITENYFIIVEQPLTVSVTGMIKCQLKNEAMASSLKWFENDQTYIYLLDRDTGDLKYTYHTEAFFYLHIINQYEKDDHVVIDICCYKDPAMLNCMYIENMKNMQKNPDYAQMFRGKPLRFVLPLKSIDNVEPSTPTTFATLMSKINSKLSFDNDKHDDVPILDGCSKILSENLVKLIDTKATAYKLPDKSIFCKPELLCDLGCETPRVYYEEHLGREYKYFYAISSDVDANNPGTLIKVDVVEKTKLTWCEKNCYPSEPIYVPDPDGEAEDDGVILSSMIWGNGDENHVGLLILCAKTWKEIGRCEFQTPGPVPKCLHGWFSPGTTSSLNKKNSL